MEQPDLTMNRNMDNIPPLEQGETPWTSAEVQVREAMLASEVDAPADLESKVMEALDATPQAAASGGAVKWLAAALVSSALVWASLGGKPDPAEVASPVQEIPASISGEASEVVGQEIGSQVGETDAVVNDVEALADQPDVTLESEEAQEAPARMEPMEAMNGRSASPLGTASEGQLDLQIDSAQPKLERRPATLEVKQ